MFYKIEEVLLSWRKLRIVFFKQKKFFFWRRQKLVRSQGEWTDLPLPITMGVLCLSIVLHTWMGTCSSIWAGRLIFTGCRYMWIHIWIYIDSHHVEWHMWILWIYVDIYWFSPSVDWYISLSVQREICGYIWIYVDWYIKTHLSAD